MKFIFDGHGVQDNSYKLFKAADCAAINIRAIDDLGVPINLTGSTSTLEVYTTANRKVAAVASLALTNTTAAAGHLTLTPTIANMNFGPGTYYAYVKHVVTSGTVVSISTNYVKLVIG
jgi:hypothetical protein